MESLFPPVVIDSDAAPVSVFASISLGTGEKGSAQAKYNGDVKLHANSERPDNGAGNTIISRGSQVTQFDISSDSINPGTIDMAADLRQESSGPDETKSLFNGTIDWRRSIGLEKFGDFAGESIGEIGFLPGTGNAFVDIAFNTAIPFQGFVGDRVSINFLMIAHSSISADVDLLNTGSFGITFNDPAVIAQVVPQVPLPGAVWLFGSGLLGMMGIARRKTGNRRLSAVVAVILVDDKGAIKNRDPILR